MKKKKATKRFKKELRRLKELEVGKLMKENCYSELRSIMCKKIAELRNKKLRRYLLENCLFLKAEEAEKDLREVLFLICCLDLEDSSFFTREERYTVGDILRDSADVKGKFVYIEGDFKELSLRRLIEVTAFL